MRTNPLALALFGPALILAATSIHARTPGTVKSPKEAKAIAEQDTGGKATSARRIPLNGASGGWEVDVRMPREDRGWRCIIDADTHMIHSKIRIDQPGRKGKAEGPVLIKGTR
jgi:hypothetical protein